MLQMKLASWECVSAFIDSGCFGLETNAHVGLVSKYLFWGKKANYRTETPFGNGANGIPLRLWNKLLRFPEEKPYSAVRSAEYHLAQWR